ncbi:MAG: SIS domain-containing protein [Firmicutes bacterium]|nr:SIS domain-containing protein [Bacillota bacterium]
MIQYFEKQLQTIRDSVSSMDVSAFLRLVDNAMAVLSRGNKVIISGLGKNVPICEKVVGSMISLGMNAFFMHTNSAVHGDLGAVKDGDLVILLSKSGETVESVYLAELLVKRNVDLWLLTFNKKSTLSEKVSNKIILDLEQEGDPWNVMPNNSTTINLIVLQGLVMQLAEREQLDIRELKRNHPGGYIGELLKRNDQGRMIKGE